MWVFIGWDRLVYLQPLTPPSQSLPHRTRSGIQAERRQTSSAPSFTPRIPPKFRKETASMSPLYGQDLLGETASHLISCTQVSCSRSSPPSWRRSRSSGSFGISKIQETRSPLAVGNANTSAMVSIGGYTRPSSTGSPCYSKFPLFSLRPA